MPAAPDGQEPGRPANAAWEMTGPVTDHVLIGTTALALSACVLAGRPARLRRRARKETGEWRSNPASGGSRWRSGRS